MHIRDSFRNSNSSLELHQGGHRVFPCFPTVVSTSSLNQVSGWTIPQDKLNQLAGGSTERDQQIGQFLETNCGHRCGQKKSGNSCNLWIFDLYITESRVNSQHFYEVCTKTDFFTFFLCFANIPLFLYNLNRCRVSFHEHTEV